MFKGTAFILAATFASAAARSATAPSVPLEPLRQEDLAPGCTCTFSLHPHDVSTASPIFALDLASGQGLVRLDGTLVRLNRVSSKEVKKHDRRDSVGDRFTESWTSGSVDLEFRYKTTFVCPSSDASCTRTDYEGLLSVSFSSTSYRHAVWGTCGCPNGA